MKKWIHSSKTDVKAGIGTGRKLCTTLVHILTDNEYS